MKTKKYSIETDELFLHNVELSEIAKYLHKYCIEPAYKDKTYSVPCVIGFDKRNAVQVFHALYPDLYTKLKLGTLCYVHAVNETIKAADFTEDIIDALCIIKETANER